MPGIAVCGGGRLFLNHVVWDAGDETKGRVFGKTDGFAEKAHARHFRTSVWYWL